ncbi:MAG TPA: OmpA family protein [Saprospiraceae bacterium]|nr:OmpA family protein [Saprospiraceae bacterium]
MSDSCLRRFVWLCTCVFPLTVHAQKETLIYLQNPSFEDTRAPGRTPAGWTDCGAAQESPPDVQPGSFDVTTLPKHGTSYLGLVVRDNETWEAVSQRLSRPLEANQCYEFSIDLCKAEHYKSLSKTTNQPTDYVTPVRLLVWGGNGACGKQELLYETPIITNTRWITTVFRLHPSKGNYSHIMLEAYYRTPVLFPYNGNVMLDNASPIKQIPCNPEAMPDMVEKKEKPSTPAKKLTAKGADTTKNTAPAKPTTPPAAKPEPVVTYKGEKIKKGSIIRLDKVYFDADKYSIKAASESNLKEVYTFLLNNPAVSVEIGGHTNNVPNDQFAGDLSTNRAKAVADWIISQGITPQRVLFKGYGKTRPIQPNTTPEGRMKNQRVEIKVLNING